MSDRLFGLVVLMVSLAFIASATQVQTSFLTDPVGPKAFPMLIGGVAAVCSLVLMFKPDPSPQWPVARSLFSLFIAVIVLVAYAYALRPFGFLVPTAIAAGILSFQISPRAVPAITTGIVLSVGLFVLFRFALKLQTLQAFPRDMFS